MVFIHPVIISNPAQGHMISQSKYTYLQEQQRQLSTELSEMKEIEITPELKAFPDAPAVPEKTGDDPNAENDPDAGPEEKNQ